MIDDLELRKRKAKAKLRLRQMQAEEVTPEKQPAGATRSFEDPYANSTVMEKLLPSTMANKGNFQTVIGMDGKPIQTNVNPLQLAGDVMGIPTRALGSATGQGSMADPESGIMRPVRERMIETMKDPEAGYFKKGLAGMGYLGASMLEDPTTFTGIGWAKAPQKVKDVIKTGLQAGKQATKTAIKAPNKLVGMASEELTGVSQEALRKASTKEGRKALEDASGRQWEIGNELIDRIEKLSKGMPEQEAVKKSLEGMGEMDLKSAVDALKSSKVKPLDGDILLPHEKSANDLIDNYISIIDDKVETMKVKVGDKVNKQDFYSEGQTPETTPIYKDVQTKTPRELPATKYKDLRERFDVTVNFDKEGYNLVNNALKKTRTTMKDELLKRAELSGDAEYAKNMKSWANKLDKLESIKDMLGGDSKTRASRVEGFISRLFGKNNEHKRKLVADLDEIYGGQILEKSKMARLAGELGTEGKAGIFPRQMSGRALLGQAVGMTLGVGVTIPFTSPYLVTRLSMPIAQELEKLALKTGGKFSKTSQKAIANMLGTTNRALQTRLLAVVTKEAGKLDQKEEK
jgi:hypothetical protein